MVTKAGEKAKTYTTYFTYSPNVSNNARQVVKQTVQKLQQKTKKNRQFFDNLNICLCDRFANVKSATPFGKYIKENFYGYDNIQGVSIYGPLNDNNKEIIIKTNSRDFGTFDFLAGEELPEEEITGVLLHEMGHQFDYSFGYNDKNLIQQYNQNNISIIRDDVLEDTVNQIVQKSGLRNSEEFKKAWMEDVNNMKDMPDEEYAKLGYLSPNYYSDIDISDGVDNEELEKAEPDRGEALAQLFSFAVQEKIQYNIKNDSHGFFNKDAILKAYPKLYAFVKSMVNKFLGI